MPNEQTNENYDKEKARTVLIKQLYDESFYGVLGTHPKADVQEIREGFRSRIRTLSEPSEELEDSQLANILKAYATLTSSYKADYDQYLEQYKQGLEEAVEVFYESGVSVENLTKHIQPWSTKMQPWSVLMQPWATGKKVSMQPWSTSKK